MYLKRVNWQQCMEWERERQTKRRNKYEEKLHNKTRLWDLYLSKKIISTIYTILSAIFERRMYVEVCLTVSFILWLFKGWNDFFLEKIMRDNWLEGYENQFLNNFK